MNEWACRFIPIEPEVPPEVQISPAISTLKATLRECEKSALRCLLFEPLRSAEPIWVSSIVPCRALETFKSIPA